MGTRTNILADHTVPDPLDREAVLDRLAPSLTEALAIRQFWNAWSPDETRDETDHWVAEPTLPRPHDKYIAYDGPGNLYVEFGSGCPFVKVRASLRWRGFLSIEPFRLVHLRAFRKIAVLLGASRIVYMPDDDFIDDVRWEGGSLDKCVAQLRQRWGEPQVSVEAITPEIVEATDYGVPQVWFIESISSRHTAGSPRVGPIVGQSFETSDEAESQPTYLYDGVGGYDEDEAVMAYIERHWKSYMTDFERECRSLAARRVEAILHPAATSPQTVLAEWEQADGAIRERIACGLKAFDRTVRERILNEAREGSLQVNRCPRCRRVVRTPTARQCFSCGYDWHA